MLNNINGQPASIAGTGERVVDADMVLEIHSLLNQTHHDTLSYIKL